MTPLNYAQKIMLWLTIWSCVLISIVWILIVRFSPFTSREAAMICAMWLLIAASLAFLAVVLGQRVGKRLIFESSLAQKLRDLEGNIATFERERKHIQDHLLEAIIIIDHSNKIVSLNRAARKLLNLSKAIDGQSLAELIREPEIHEIVQQAKEQQLDLEGSIRFGAINPITMYARAAPMVDGMVLLSLLEVKQFNILDERHDDFITHASHELKTPVAIILANTELLLENPQPDSDSAQLLHAVYRQALRAKNLLESLLDLLRLNAGHYAVKAEKIDLHQFFGELRASLGHVGNIIKNDIAEGTLVKTDRILFERLAHIIVENAQKYAGQSPELAISARPQGDYLKIQFADNGPGIKNHLRERVFEKFFRQPEHESVEKEGFGLGLSHARAIAQSLGGRIFVEESMGHGCTIAVLLDACNSDVNAMHQRTNISIN